MSKTWRDSAAKIIAEVISKVGLDDAKALRKALREAYPWGPRKQHPYKIWCDEIRVQTGKKKAFNSRGSKHKQPKSCDGQTDLF